MFYLNLPLGGIATVVLFFFLKVRSDSSKNTAPKMMRIDWIGNLLFVLSMTSILIALSWYVLFPRLDVMLIIEVSNANLKQGR